MAGTNGQIGNGTRARCAAPEYQSIEQRVCYFEGWLNGASGRTGP